MEMIEIYSGTGDLDKAAATVNVLRKLAPTNEAVLYTAYRVYSDLAADALLSLSVVAPNSARMHQALAHELAKRGKTEEAIQNYREALKLDPQLPGIHFELAEMLSTLATPNQLFAGRPNAESRSCLEANPEPTSSPNAASATSAAAATIERSLRPLRARRSTATRRPRRQHWPRQSSDDHGPAAKSPAASRTRHTTRSTSAAAHFRLSAVYRELGRPEDAKHEIEEYQKYKRHERKAGRGFAARCARIKSRKEATTPLARISRTAANNAPVASRWRAAVSSAGVSSALSL